VSDQVEPRFKDMSAPKPRKKKRGRARPDEPMRWRCEICAEHAATERHHKLRRSAGGTDDAANTMDLCGWCHAEVHRNVAHSYEQGYLLRRTG
jgi:hypothetical protein